MSHNLESKLCVLYYKVNMITKRCIPAPMCVLISKWENLEYFFLYPDSEVHHFKTLMGFRLDQDAYYRFLFMKIQAVVFT